MSQLRDNMISFISATEIDEMVEKLAKEIEQDYEGQEIVLICPCLLPI